MNRGRSGVARTTYLRSGDAVYLQVTSLKFARDTDRLFKPVRVTSAETCGRDFSDVHS